MMKTLRRIETIAAAMIILLLILVLLVSVGTQLPQPVKKQLKHETDVHVDILDEKDLAATARLAKALPEPVPDDDLSGALPPLQASYRNHIGFSRYAREMAAAGADFYIVDKAGHGICRFDPATNTISRTSMDRIRQRSYSGRTRLIYDEPALQPALNESQSGYGFREPEVIMLVPLALENRIAAKLVSTCRTQPLSLELVSGFKGIYYLSGGSLMLKVEKAVLKNGSTKELDVTIRI